MSPVETLCLPAPLWTPPTSLTGSARIAAINDQFRRTLGALTGPRIPGKMVMTRGVADLGPVAHLAIFRTVRAYDDFGAENDPHGERDFGAFTVASIDERLFWKIDIYANAACAWGAEDEDRGEPGRSFRLLTVLLASEY